MPGLNANTVLMLHGDGIDGATFAEDSSASSQTVNINGATLNLSTVKFGLGSCGFSGGNQFLTVDDDADLELTDGESLSTFEPIYCTLYQM